MTKKNVLTERSAGEFQTWGLWVERDLVSGSPIMPQSGQWDLFSVTHQSGLTVTLYTQLLS